MNLVKLRGPAGVPQCGSAAAPAPRSEIPPKVSLYYHRYLVQQKSPSYWLEELGEKLKEPRIWKFSSLMNFPWATAGFEYVVCRSELK